jgi:hypothetical protein
VIVGKGYESRCPSLKNLNGVGIGHKALSAAARDWVEVVPNRKFKIEENLTVLIRFNTGWRPPPAMWGKVFANGNIPNTKQTHPASILICHE